MKSNHQWAFPRAKILVVGGFVLLLICLQISSFGWTAPIRKLVLLFTKSGEFSEHDGTSSTNDSKIVYPDDGHAQGILSNVSVAHLRSLQHRVDELSHTERCMRYGFFYNRTSPKKRRIFYGANIADEPWELYEIVAAEAYGIFEGMVFVESNRTQVFMPRPFKRLKHDGILRRLFGANQLQIRAYVNETKSLQYLDRENMQRNNILLGWKEMGMTPEDIGYVTDPDETFSRDFLRAVQICDGIDAFDYNSHGCGVNQVKLASSTRVFEMTPECIIRDYNWYHPDMVIGACIELIGNDTIHRYALRKGLYRSGKFVNDNRTTLWNPFDFRMTGGGYQYWLKDPDNYYDIYTGYHFHNFFSDFNATRFKYFSFGHANPHAWVRPLERLSDELTVGIRCIKNMTDIPNFRHQRVRSGFLGIKPMLPLYFLDEEYRRRRHSYMQERVTADERALRATLAHSAMPISPSAPKRGPEKTVLAEKPKLSNVSVAQLRSLRRVP